MHSSLYEKWDKQEEKGSMAICFHRKSDFDALLKYQKKHNMVESLLLTS